MKCRQWRNRKGWELFLFWEDEVGGSIDFYNPHTFITCTLASFDRWGKGRASDMVEALAESMSAKEKQQ